MDKIKEAFDKVKLDMNSFNSELTILKKEMAEIVQFLQKINEKVENITLKHPLEASTQELQKPTFPTQASTRKHPVEPLKPQYLGISTGNQGASTDRQTNRQTNRHTLVSYGDGENAPFKTVIQEKDNSIDNAARILDSLDSIKKDVRLKFKRLTDQEILVFSTLYQLDEEFGYTDYKALAEKLKLTESSIRDYIGRLIKKGIPVEKIRIDNKFIRLKVSENLKKIASLQTILQLRDL
jgi:DNA-binding MarR family transcriptional regulator